MEFLLFFSALGVTTGSSCVSLMTPAPLLWSSFLPVTLVPGLGEPVSFLCPCSLRLLSLQDPSVASLSQVDFLTFPITCVISSLHKIPPVLYP